MSPSFDRWLARPSTIRLLRGLLRQPLALTSKVNHNYLHTKQSRHNVATFAFVHELEDYDQEAPGRYVPPKNDASIKRHRIPSTLPRDKPKAALPECEVQKSIQQSTRAVDNVTTSTAALGSSGVHVEAKLHTTASIEEVLLQGERSASWQGVFKAWRNLSVERHDIPVSGSSAEKVWDILLSNATHAISVDGKNALLKELYHHLLRTKNDTDQTYEHLYKHIIGYALRHPAKGTKYGLHAIEWHARLKEDGFLRTNDIMTVIPDVTRSSDQELAFRQWKTIYLRGDSRSSGQEVDQTSSIGRRIAKFLDSAGARSVHASESGMDALRSLALTTSTSAEVQTGSQDGVITDPKIVFSRAVLNSIIGDAHGISEKQISDGFCAKIIATRLFPPHISIPALRMLGVQELGSIALRELARRAKSPQEMLDKLRLVEENDLTIVNNNFRKLLQRLATQRDVEGMQALLDSDQHPDNYDDHQLQWRLLREFRREGQWTQVHITLQALTVNNDVRMARGLWNTALRAILAKSNMQAAQRTLGSMKMNKVVLLQETLRSASDALLSSRKTGKAPDHRNHSDWGDKLDLLTKTYIQAAELGQVVSTTRWVEILKRYGITGRREELERLLLWLGRHYMSLHDRDITASYKTTASVEKQRKAISDIFSDNMLAAIVLWTWRWAIVHRRMDSGPASNDSLVPEISAESHSNTRDCNEWARGLVLLGQLQRCGLRFKASVIQTAVAQQLWILFGPDRSDAFSRKLNGIMRSKNRLPLHDYVEHINNIWKGLLPAEMDTLSRQEHSHNQLRTTLFGDRQEGRSSPYGQASSSTWT